MYRRFLLLFSLIITVSASAEEKFQPTWESLGHYQTPEWYQDAKFGIWPHWGVYSVPAERGDHAAEWYGRWMYSIEKGELRKNHQGKPYNDYYFVEGLKTAQHHRDKYGDPTEFGYHDFVPMWKAEKWDPDEWADLAVASGARFFCMMGMHHDGFCLYDSDLTRWDSVEMGPKRDFMSEIREAIRERGLKFGVSNHFAWNFEFFGFYHRNGFAKGQEEYADLYSRGVVDDDYLKRWWDRTIELVDKSDCDLYYFDWGWNRGLWHERDYHAKFTSTFYNKSIEAGKGTFADPGVVLCNKQWHIPPQAATKDLERGKMPDIQEHVWQTDTSISINSWGYATSDEYRSADQLIDSLMDIISKNGVMMLNFGPKADGTIPDEYKQPLLDMGAWLKICGEAVYATRPYLVFGESPEKEEGDDHPSHDHEVVYTGKDIRFTQSKGGTILYATALDWPGDEMLITSLAGARLHTIKSVRLLGVEGELKWKKTPEGMLITMPEKPTYGIAYPIRIKFDRKIDSPASK